MIIVIIINAIYIYKIMQLQMHCKRYCQVVINYTVSQKREHAHCASWLSQISTIMNKIWHS